MITLLTPRVWKEITAAAVISKAAHVAVAYFGAAGDKLLPLTKGSSIVVDATLPTLAAGSTCPMALERLRKRGTDIYSAQHLHAKVYAFDSVAFVGSANASNRSQFTLIEAVLRVDTEVEISAARAFVKSICLTKLSATDLAELSQYYRPPRFPTTVPSPQQRRYSTLLMELTLEQGGGRETQVQPPKAVWEYYFGIKVGLEKLPTLSLINESVFPPLETRRTIVKHHHNYTIELVGSELPRPAILQMRRVGKNTYSYSVHRPGDDTFTTKKELLETMPNPLRHSGRLWILI
jgi:hypothetical protein